MPREIVVNEWCDPCFKEGLSTPAEGVTVALADLARFKPQVMLLCERHHKEVYQPMRELLEEFGVVVESEAKQPRQAARRQPLSLDCQVPGCQTPPLASMDSLGKHVRRLHGLSLRDYRAEYGKQSPRPAASSAVASAPAGTTTMPLRNIPETGVPMFCPVDDCSLGRPTDRPAKNKRTLATHFRQRHDNSLGGWFRDHPDADPESFVIRG